MGCMWLIFTGHAMHVIQAGRARLGTQSPGPTVLSPDWCRDGGGHAHRVRRCNRMNQIKRTSIMIYKILGAVLVLAGVYLVAKVEHYPFGVILLFIGFYIALRLGMKPK